MIRRLDRDYVQAELAGLAALLEVLPESDVLGRMSLESRRAELQEQLKLIVDRSEHRARIALFFSGDPVIGSVGVQAEFGATALGTFQDLIARVWATGEAPLAPTGPIPRKASAQLHITSLLQGSFGFLLEELDEEGEPLFETALRLAADRTLSYIAQFSSENESEFVHAIEDIDQRVFSALRGFIGSIYRSKATVRIVEGETDQRLDRLAIERAWVRIDTASIDDDQLPIEGRLLGVIPMARKFEFEADGRSEIIEGKVGEQLSQSYLERINNEQFAGRRWRALLRRKVVRRVGRLPIERYTLLQLEEISPRPA